MNPRPDPRYASAKGPVNRRTAPREGPTAAPVHTRVQRQLQHTQARQLLGAPLSHQLTRQASRSSARPSGVRHAVLGLAPIAGLAGAWLLWQQAGPAALAAGGALLAGSVVALVWAWRNRRRAQQLAGMAAPAGLGFDPQALARLDQVLELLAPQVPGKTLARLVGLKSTLVRMAPLLAQAQVSEHFTPDDRLYIGECVRRYLPDSLQGWLQVPAHLRAVAGEADGLSAQALLDQQLELLQAELLKREQKLGLGAAEPLRQQQRFLGDKHRRGG